MTVKCISGSPEYIEEQLGPLLTEGWTIVDLTTNLYDSTGGIRKETTVYLSK